MTAPEHEPTALEYPHAGSALANSVALPPPSPMGGGDDPKKAMSAMQLELERAREQQLCAMEQELREMRQKKLAEMQAEQQEIQAKMARDWDQHKSDMEDAEEELCCMAERLVMTKTELEKEQANLNSLQNEKAAYEASFNKQACEDADIRAGLKRTATEQFKNMLKEKQRRLEAQRDHAAQPDKPLDAGADVRAAKPGDSQDAAREPAQASRQHQNVEVAVVPETMGKGVGTRFTSSTHPDAWAALYRMARKPDTLPEIKELWNAGGRALQLPLSM